MIEIKVKYDLSQRLFCMQDNKVKEFYPNSLKIESFYAGYSGENWGDSDEGKGGWPIRIFYSEGNTCVVEKPSTWMPQDLLFTSKEDLINSL